MARGYRIDLHRLDGAEVLPSGDLRVPARVARVGVLRYSDGQNSWGELVPPETLFDPASMASLRGVALTDLHPGAPVTPESRRALQRGHVGDLVAQDGPYLTAPVYVTDAETIGLVQSGERRDVSCGYECEVDETPGTFEGVPYDRVQRGRVYNHLGVGPEGWGRAGTDVSLRLDGGAAVARLDGGGVARVDSTTNGAGAASPAGTRSMKTIKIRGKAYRLDADEEMAAAQKACDAMEEDVAKTSDIGSQLDAANNALMDAMKTIAEMKAKLALAEAAKPEAPAVTEESVPEPVADSIVAKRLAKLDAARSSARAAAPEVKLDGLLSTRKIHEAALALAVPEVKLDGLSDERLAGMVEALAAGAKKAAASGRKADGSARNDGLANAHRAAAGDPNAPREDGGGVEGAIRKMHEDTRDDWRTAAPALRVSATVKAD